MVAVVTFPGKIPGPTAEDVDFQSPVFLHAVSLAEYGGVHDSGLSVSDWGTSLVSLFLTGYYLYSS